jgi:hypothetical protein
MGRSENLTSILCVKSDRDQRERMADGFAFVALDSDGRLKPLKSLRRDSGNMNMATDCPTHKRV